MAGCDDNESKIRGLKKKETKTPFHKEDKNPKKTQKNQQKANTNTKQSNIILKSDNLKSPKIYGELNYSCTNETNITTLTTASSSFSTMSILSGPIPVESTVIRMPL